MRKFLECLLDDVQRFTFYSADDSCLLIREAKQPWGWVKTGEQVYTLRQIQNVCKHLRYQGAVITWRS